MIILGIETSCDETAISVVEAKGSIEELSFAVLGSAVHSQVEMHTEYGGVVPGLAKREHIKNLPIVYKEALRKAEMEEGNLPDGEAGIEMICVTVGPGLEPALWTGIVFAKELGERLKIPVVGTNHMLGHVASVLFNNKLESKKAQVENKIKFPALALLISGGHTELVLLNSWGDKRKIGETVDDAVGEAFDKVARMLGLPYPGGPEISALAEQARNSNIEIRDIKFPRPMLRSKDLNFSFSGLKTAVLYYLRELRNVSVNEPCKFDETSTRNFSAEKYPCEGTETISQFKKMQIAREFENAVIETLLTKTKKAIEEHMPKTLIIGGGVIANKALRENFLNLNRNYPDLSILIPEKSLTTDNATMIAAAGYIEYLQNKENKIELKADGNLDIT